MKTGEIIASIATGREYRIDSVDGISKIEKMILESIERESVGHIFQDDIRAGEIIENNKDRLVIVFWNWYHSGVAMDRKTVVFTKMKNVIPRMAILGIG